MELEKLLIEESKRDYKCFEILKNLLKNPTFSEIIKEGIIEGKISGFDINLWTKIENQNIRRINSFDDVFKEGLNIGYCTVAAKQLSYSLDTCFICGGELPILKNTPNCENGEHTWILYNNDVIDTTLMLFIDKEYATKLGYIEENRYNPNQDPIYSATKEFTNDNNLKK